jgi:hypothetical protein
MDECESCEHKDERESDNPQDSSRPTYAVEVEEEIGEPLVACDIVAHKDEGDI